MITDTNNDNNKNDGDNNNKNNKNKDEILIMIMIITKQIIKIINSSKSQYKNIYNMSKRYCNAIVIIVSKYSSPKNEPVLADI